VKKAAIAVIDLWTEMLSDLSAESVLNSVSTHIKTNKFPPTIAEIRARVANMTLQAVTAADVWAECNRLLNWNISATDEVRAYENMSEVCREAVMACGGWQVLSMSPENDSYFRRTFMQAAETRLKRDYENGVDFDYTRVNTLTPVNDSFLLEGNIDA
jgi:hypothetical protein